MPSAYAWPVVAAIVDGPWQPTLVYPARGVAELWAVPTPPPRALARLLGQTRALLLVSLEPPDLDDRARGAARAQHERGLGAPPRAA